MARSTPEPNEPFRWDLGAGDRLGSLLDGIDPPNLWYAGELVDCAAKVVARSADGDLFFVGRSLDSLFDLLTGALGATSCAARVHRLPFSVRFDDLDAGHVRQLRANLTAAGLAPHDLARRRRPVVFTDVVAYGRTFGALFAELRRWIAEERAQWDVIRLKLRFVGVTWRKHTSPNTWRWQQHADWVAELPARAVVNVSLAESVWQQLADRQPKTARSFRPERWIDGSVRTPPRDREAREALAEAVALVALGRDAATRDRLARLLAEEPAFAEPWLRSLALELRQ